MFDIKYPPPLERVILAGLQTPKTDPALFEIDMKEMMMLCATAGAKVADVVVQKRESPVWVRNKRSRQGFETLPACQLQ